MADDTGAPHEIPYPEATDPPAGHTQMQALAERVHSLMPQQFSAYVATSQTTASASPVDLGTVGPSITVTSTDDLSWCAIVATVRITPSGAGHAYVTLCVDGTPLGHIMKAAAGASVGLYNTVPGSPDGTAFSYLRGPLYQPLSTGVHTIKLQYESVSGTATFQDRFLSLVMFTPE